MIRIQTDDFDVGALLEDMRRTHEGAQGAILSFVGYVRDFAPDTHTQTLFLEHYPGMCEREIERICETAKKRWDILSYQVVHRVGALHHGDQIVFLAVASRHRTEAFRAGEFIIDSLKTRAPFWKREHLRNGQTFWVAQRQEDAERTARWQAQIEQETAQAPSAIDS